MFALSTNCEVSDGVSHESLPLRLPDDNPEAMKVGNNDVKLRYMTSLQVIKYTKFCKGSSMPRYSSYILYRGIILHI